MNITYRIAQIKDDICYYKNMIEESTIEITRLSSEIEGLEDVHRKYLKVKDEYEEYQYQQQRQSEQLKTRFKHIKFSKKLSRKILRKLKGNHANNSLNGIEKVLEDTRYYIQQDDDERNNERNRITQYENRVSELEYELRTLMYQL